jgi:uncharacterized protein (TIGR02300 family)
MQRDNLKKKLGNRLECPDCGTKFYDLNKPIPSCPSCGSAPRTVEKVKTRAPKIIEVEIEAPEEVEVPAEDMEALAFDTIEDDDLHDFADEGA